MEEEDRLPEFIQYRDQGCELAPSCLGCPFPHCRYDLPRPQREGRDDAVRSLRREGATIAELAQRFALSERQVHRILRRRKVV